ncbi:MAG TPA: Fe-S cluster assembly ATPase SufC [Actinomycetota bacterium]|nr:Fe-S cluster assembly ATPase SufC [Actinomycetota bacterium]
MSEPLLLIENLSVAVGEGDDAKQILRGVDLKIFPGEIHAIMGPNGSGKSTLASALMGKPGYEVTGGRIVYKGEDLADLSPDERARRRIFLAFQYPTEIPGVSVVNFLRTAYNAVHADKQLGPLEFRKYLQTKMDMLDVPDSMINRYVNAGFSGGERKRAEVLQMAVLDPDLAVLDETDTGLDIDALKEVSAGVLKVHNERRGMLVITHYQRLLNYIEPGFIHVLINGRIVRSGGKDLALDLEAKGYDQFRSELGIPAGEDLSDEV